MFNLYLMISPPFRLSLSCLLFSSFVLYLSRGKNDIGFVIEISFSTASIIHECTKKKTIHYFDVSILAVISVSFLLLFKLTEVHSVTFLVVEKFSLLKLVSRRLVKVATEEQSRDDGILVTFTYTSLQKCVVIDRFTFRYTYINMPIYI